MHSVLPVVSPSFILFFSFFASPPTFSADSACFTVVALPPWGGGGAAYSLLWYQVVYMILDVHEEIHVLFSGKAFSWWT